MNGPLTWDLAARAATPADRVSAGQHVLAAAGLAARDVAGLLAIGLVVIVAYLASCRIWPYARCLACLGSRRNPGSNSKRHGRCRACRGTGERLRIGTRLIRAWTNGRWPK